MPKYTPGSFTKNFGWSQNGAAGMKALYDAIRQGFHGIAQPVKREDFRKDCGVAGPSQQLIPINFFLHNHVARGENHVTVDELVRHAINNPHSKRFDRLALFALHLTRQGEREGVAGEPVGAAFTNEYVRSRLWDGGGWRNSRLTDNEVEQSFKKTIIAKEGSDTVHKCVTNYLYILQVSGLRDQRTHFINTHIDEWVGPGLFLAFDRYWMDEHSGSVPSQDELLEMAEAEELHKLMGVSAEYLASVAPVFAQEYLELGGLQRVSGAAVIGGGRVIASSPVMPPVPAGAKRAAAAPGPVWSDQDAEDAAIVMRRLQEVQAQVRNARHVRELKGLYEHTCAFCGKQTIVGVGPDRYYSEAAHIKPVGEPHNGPDRKENMIVLCPEHHLQFDRGVLTIHSTDAGFEVRSKIPGDKVHKRALLVKDPHEVSEEFTVWHANFWR